MSHRHYLQYLLLDARTTEAERQAARRELAAGVVQTQPTIAEWIKPRIVLAKTITVADNPAK